MKPTFDDMKNMVHYNKDSLINYPGISFDNQDNNDLMENLSDHDLFCI